MVAVAVGAGVIVDSHHQTPVAPVAGLASRPSPDIELLGDGLVADGELALGLLAVLLRHEPAPPCRGGFLHLDALDAAAGSDILLPCKHPGLDNRQLLEIRPYAHPQPPDLRKRFPGGINPQHPPADPGRIFPHLKRLVARQLVRRPVILLLGYKILYHSKR